MSADEGCGCSPHGSGLKSGERWEDGASQGSVTTTTQTLHWLSPDR